jgi:hypothetical protein
VPVPVPTARVRRNRCADPGLARLALAIVLVSAVATVVVLGDRLSFFNDDWWFLFQRPGLESHGGLDALFAPHNSNLVFLPTIAYKLLVAVFGLSSQVPYRLVLGLAFGVLGLLVYALVSRRAGWAWGLAAAAVVTLLGPAWEDLLFFASIDLIGSLIAGLAALLALEGNSPRRNLVACAALTAAVLSSNVGIAFAVGAGVCVLVRRRPSQLWILVVPLLVFAVWWVGYGRSAPSHISGANLEHLPSYVINSAAAGMASLTGLASGSSYTRGRIVLAGALLLIGAWRFRGGRFTTAVVAPLVTLLVFWILSGASFYPGREPFASRYQLIDVTLIVIVAAELFGAGRSTARWSSLAIVLAVAVVTANTARSLSFGYRFLRDQAGYVQADLGIMQALRPRIPPTLWLVQSVSQNPYLSGITGARYLSQTAAHGTPGVFSIAQIMRASAGQRQSVDGVLVAIEQIHFQPSRAPTGVRCSRVGDAPGDHSADTSLAPGTVWLSNVGRAGLAAGLRRFAPSGRLIGVALIAPGATDRAVIPDDALPIRWHVQLFSGSASEPPVSMRVCQ